MLAEDESFITLGERKGREENADGWTGILAHGPAVGAGGGHSRGHWGFRSPTGSPIPAGAGNFSRKPSLPYPSCCLPRCWAFMSWSRWGRTAPWAAAGKRSPGTPWRLPLKDWSSDPSCTVFRSRCSLSRPRSRRWTPRLVAASQTLGASRVRTFFRVILPAVAFRPGHRSGPQLRPHHGRVRRGADGRRKYSRSHANGFDRYL